ncbi:class I SAM-dependent methyltransferase [Vibrio albus]|uniref:Class I SAM-dependent methyltransferase n=1 Tax=Vibrio albus TaxID=2200953 RepID=A0A2U3B6L6_9VIBR|nr:class I SAM-dependent methyltransferase [Vibrio albus]PWI32427.1 class I SAM-dependent methyltransferase [Vibrio albus]
MGISFSEPERLKEIFDAEHREEWQKTSHIMSSLALRENEVIADIGAGTGYFSNLFSQTIKSGKVYAIDCEPNMVAYMKNRFSESGFAHLTVVQSEADDPCIPAGVNTVFLANTYRFILKRNEFLQKMREQTAPGTRFVFVDFKGSHARVSPQMAMDEVQGAGFKVLNFDAEGCPDHYILTFSAA